MNILDFPAAKKFQRLYNIKNSNHLDWELFQKSYPIFQPFFKVDPDEPDTEHVMNFIIRQHLMWFMVESITYIGLYKFNMLTRECKCIFKHDILVNLCYDNIGLNSEATLLSIFKNDNSFIIFDILKQTQVYTQKYEFNYEQELQWHPNHPHQFMIVSFQKIQIYDQFKLIQTIFLEQLDMKTITCALWGKNQDEIFLACGKKIVQFNLYTNKSSIIYDRIQKKYGSIRNMYLNPDQNLLLVKLYMGGASKCTFSRDSYGLDLIFLGLHPWIWGELKISHGYIYDTLGWDIHHHIYLLQNNKLIQYPLDFTALLKQLPLSTVNYSEKYQMIQKFIHL